MAETPGAHGWKQRTIQLAGRTRDRVPAVAGWIDRAEAVSVRLANLRRWSDVDARSFRADTELALALSEPPVEPLLHPGTRTTQRCSRMGDPPAVICSMGTGPHIPLLAVSAPTLLDYGERHGWDVVLSTETWLAEDRPASWGKLKLIEALLDEYELVWWLDADALIIDRWTDIRRDLAPERDLYLVEHMFPSPSSFAASAGVMVWRSTDWSRQFVRQMWADEQYAYDYPWENGTLLTALGYSVTPAFLHLNPTPLMARVGLLPRDWNSVWLDPSESPKVHHHGGGSTVAERRAFMLGDLARSRQGRPPELEAPPGVDLPSGRNGYLTDAVPSFWRDELPYLLNERGLIGVGAEVGVYAAEFSARLLTLWPGSRLISIDPWLHSDDYKDVSNPDQGGFDALYTAAQRRLERFADRSDIWRMTSAQAAGKVADGSLDFVYIDARHDERSAREDIDLWFPKVRPGGILAGHDYLDGERPEGLFGVKSAVDRFVRDRGLRLHLTAEPVFPSWIVEVPPPN
ncbi:MAG TPA: class I SAM-dependent methyltransferase [Acidimicrobiales bacterium]|jgi:hypothetical protein|nr:class I SAM-dependent methyltransferase [Acidimicrobiales bacterium]